MRTAAILVLAVGTTLGAFAQMPGTGQDDGGPGPAVAMGSGRMVRGTVSAVAADKVTVKTEAGDIYTAVISSNTRVMKGREPAKLADVKVGDGIGAMGELDQPSRTVHALFISVVPAEEVKKMREAMGKTWISGKVTAIDDLKLTILRPDKITQVIAVDEDTSFKRGGRGMAQMMRGDSVVAMPREGDRGAGANSQGESITLADVKVGDNVAGQGSLKNGVFVPTTLAVADPSQRRHRQGEGAPAPEPKQ